LVGNGRAGFAGRFADESGGLFLFQAGAERDQAKLADDDPYHVEAAPIGARSRNSTQ
jgi:hypothetical protein